VALAALAPAPLRAAELGAPGMTVVPIDREPPPRAKPSEAELSELRRAIAEAPKLRKPRFDLVHTLVRAGRLEEARKEAIEWRLHDAYSLVAVRQVGDIEAALGDTAKARRTYSANAELLPKDVEARRALATLFKQAGDFESARTQLLAALELRPDDRRTTFELGDVEERLGHHAEAAARFEATANATDATEALRYPAKQRLSQIFAADRRAAIKEGDKSRATALAERIKALDIHGGSENDIKIFLSWDTDQTDIDLWVTTPSGEKVFYSHRQGKGGEALFDDVTTGYGPESFTANRAQRGDYTVQVNFFGARSAFKEARGEVVVVLDEGRPTERREVFPYRIFDEKDTATVAKIHVRGDR
jgi:tetratricopeptide (TPR) repeat protein